MDLLYTVVLILAAFALVLSMGWGLSYGLLPGDYRRYAPMVAPAMGLLVFCSVAITISGSFNLAVSLSVKLAAALLIGTSIVVAAVNRRALSPGSIEWRDLAVLSAVMIVVGFWSVLDQGSGMYLGTVNPDYSQSLSFLDALVRFDLPFFVDHETLPQWQSEPFVADFPHAFQARFGAVTFAHLMTVLGVVDQRAALVTTILLGLLCLPPAVYFFSRAMLGMERRAAMLASAFVSISAPVSMSLIHALVGQNSAIASIPLGLTLGFLAIKSSSARLWLCLLLVINSLVFVYVMMAPFIIAPLGAFALYKLAVENGSYRLRFLKSMAVLVVVLVIVNAGMTGILMRFIDGLSTLLGSISQSHRYVDYLTESVVVYGMGTAAYPMGSSLVFRYLGPWSSGILFGVASATSLALYLYSLRLWTRGAERNVAVAVGCGLTVYLTLGIYYTFLHPYGYSSFKLVSWLNFVVLPFMAYACVRGWDGFRQSDPALGRAGGLSLIASVAAFFIAFNVVASVEYGRQSYGQDRQAGLINAYGVGGNPDWKEVTAALSRHTPAGSTIALAFPEFIESKWGNYYAYLAGRSVAYPSHRLFPDEEAPLPDRATGLIRDVDGRFILDRRPFFNDGRADFYLVRGSNNPNLEIVEPQVSGKALWENGTVRLLKASEAKDLLVTGRGFYRLEYVSKESLPWWFPDRFRWAAEGGEILHLNPAHPGEAYRLSFVVIVGYGLAQDTRTLEIYHNGRKFDEQSVSATARIVSAPYYPVAGSNRITVRIKEQSGPVLNKRSSRWNSDIPTEWRRLNAAFADVHVLHGEPAGTGNGAIDGDEITWKTLLDRAIAFNGFNIDGWLRDKGDFTLAMPKRAKAIRIRFQVPGIAEFSFPYAIKFVVGERTFAREFKEAGEHQVEFPLDSGSAGELKVEIIPATARRVAATEGGRDVIQSVHLESVAFVRND